MPKDVIFFSGGLSSFAVAHHIKDKKPLLYFTDTHWEDEDLYRFIYEVSDKMKLPLLIHSYGIDPVQLMIKQRIIFNSRLGSCSAILKMKIASDYFKKGVVPPEVKWYNKQYLEEEDIDVERVYFGIGYDEFHRVGAIKKNWQPFDVKFPLVETMYDFDKLLKEYDIVKPRLYEMGFTHNNCKGRCVKAGKRHFKLLYNEDRATFEQLEHVEKMLGYYVEAWHSNKHDESKLEDLKRNEEEMIKWHSSGYTYKPDLRHTSSNKKPTILKKDSLEDIRRSVEVKEQFDLFAEEEVGGCGCFIDYDEYERDKDVDMSKIILQKKER